MQETNTAPQVSAVNASSPETTLTQQSSPPQPGIDQELLHLVDKLVGEIKECTSYALGWRIMIGIKLRQFRDSLDADDWNQVLQSRRLPFSARTAQTLVRIGGNRILAETKRISQLPNSITVLDQIASLPLPVIEAALAEGKIHPGTTLAEAMNIVADYRAKKAQKPSQALMLALI